MAEKSFEVGSKGANQSAEAAASAMSSTRSMPKAPSGSCRQKASAIPIGERLTSRWSSAPTGAVSRGAALDIRSTEANARVEPRVENVDRQIGEYEHRHHQHHQRLGQRIILVLHREHEKAADAVEVEDLLGHHQ